MMSLVKRTKRKRKPLKFVEFVIKINPPEKLDLW